MEAGMIELMMLDNYVLGFLEETDPVDEKRNGSESTDPPHCDKHGRKSRNKEAPGSKTSRKNDADGNEGDVKILEGHNLLLFLFN
jgi:hypothetical protein